MKLQLAFSCFLLATVNTASAGVLDNLDQNVEASTNKRALERLDSNINASSLNADYQAISGELKQCEFEERQRSDLLKLELHGARTQQALRSLKAGLKVKDAFVTSDAALSYGILEQAKSFVHDGATANLNILEAKLHRDLNRFTEDNFTLSCMDTLLHSAAKKIHNDGFADCDQATQSLSENIAKVSKQVADYQAQLQQLDSSDALKAKNLELNGGCTLAECQTDEAKREISRAKKQLWARISDDDRIIDKLQALEHHIESAEKFAKYVNNVDQAAVASKTARFEREKSALEAAKSSLDSLLAESNAKTDLYANAYAMSVNDFHSTIDSIKALENDRVVGLKSDLSDAEQTLHQCGVDLISLRFASLSNAKLAKAIADYKSRYSTQDGDSAPSAEGEGSSAAVTEAPNM